MYYYQTFKIIMSYPILQKTNSLSTQSNHLSNQIEENAKSTENLKGVVNANTVSIGNNTNLIEANKINMRSLHLAPIGRFPS